MLSGPELTRLQQEFEEEYLSGANPEHPINLQNHEQGLVAQKIFQQVNNLVETINRMGNPFMDDFPELISPDNHNYVDEIIAIALDTLEETGIKQYQDYIKKGFKTTLYLFMSL